MLIVEITVLPKCRSTFLWGILPAGRVAWWCRATGRIWSRTPDRVGARRVEGMVAIRVDATVVHVHSDKEGAAANFKGFGVHPLLSFCDNTRESLAQVMRPGTAGSNTATDHVQIINDSISAIP